MTPFLLYQVKAGICIMLFTSLYYALFRKETFLWFNRFYLVSAMAFSLILPAIRLHGISLGNDRISTVVLATVSVYANEIIHDNARELQAGSALSWVYSGVTAVFALYLVVQLIMMLVKVLRHEPTRYGRYRIISLPEELHSFSFFNFVFLGRYTLKEGDNDRVMQHELAHARQWHSLDIVILQLIKIFQWFNPFIFLAEKALQETHEYLADTAVLEQDGQPDRYRLLLITRVFGIQPGLFSFFNQSLLKNRLTMMTKEKSPPRNRLKYLAALPLVCVLGLMMCCSTSETDDSLKTPFKKAAEKFNEGIDPTTITDDDSVYIFVDEQAMFQGGDINTFREWVQKNLAYPPEAVEKGIFGRVTVQFAINSQGEIGNINILRGVDPLLDKATIAVLESSPVWVPAKYKGVPVKQQFVIPVIFLLQ